MIAVTKAETPKSWHEVPSIKTVSGLGWLPNAGEKSCVGYPPSLQLIQQALGSFADELLLPLFGGARVEPWAPRRRPHSQHRPGSGFVLTWQVE